MAAKIGTLEDLVDFKMIENSYDFPKTKFWKNKKVLITGHNGFKGSWLTLWLLSLGAIISGFSKENDNELDLFKELEISKNIENNIIDISNKEKLFKIIKSFKPDIIFHLAAQPLVRRSYKEPLLTWSTNVFGTINLLEGSRLLENKCAVIIVTSDKVYENKKSIYGYKENDKLGGHDPYSSSKAACEILTSSWRNSFCGTEIYQKNNLFIATARAGNVIGGGDWAEDRIIPDLIKASINNKPLNLRNPLATRPWQHVLEPLSGYLCLAENLFLSESKNLASSFNFGPHISSNKKVEELIIETQKYWPKDLTINYSESSLHEAYLLNLNIDKAYHELNWSPRWQFNKSVEMTTNWYKLFFYEKVKAKELCISDISKFCNLS